MFSVIIPLFNKRKFVFRAIDSVFAQSFQEFEVIVVNDGSTDGGELLVANKFEDKIQLVHQANQGVSTARNAGIDEAKYPWIAFLDADDFWHRDYLKLVAQAISENRDIGIIGTHYDSVKLDEGPALKYFRIEDYFKKAIRNTLFFTSATVLKREFFDRNRGFDPSLKLGEDIDLWIRASLYFGYGLYIENTLVHYGQDDPGQATKKQYPLNQTLIPKLLASSYFDESHKDSSCTSEEFEAFRIKWVYFNLIPHFRLSENRDAISSILAQLPASRFLLISVFYRLPFGFLRHMLAIPRISRMFRNYLKLCFRTIYA